VHLINLQDIALVVDMYKLQAILNISCFKEKIVDIRSVTNIMASLIKPKLLIRLTVFKH